MEWYGCVDDIEKEISTTRNLMEVYGFQTKRGDADDY